MSADLTDAQIRELFQWAAEEAACHRPWVCGHDDGRCKDRRANLDECDALLDQWLARHGRPVEVPSLRTMVGGPVPSPGL